MSKTCGHSKPCGCSDQALTTQAPCETGTLACPTPDPCPETFRAGCVVYTGDTIVDLGLVKGERLDVILQRMTLMITNPGCVIPTSTCLAVVGLLSSSITSTTVDLTWIPVSTALGYSVEYKLATDLTWTITTSVTTSEAVLGGLTPNTSYHIRVNATCAAGSCYSVTIEIKTQI
tara:strand:- start:3601 stop:4125 length:525 start_codon:yes stop_codon:yes gene_type:complete